VSSASDASRGHALKKRGDENPQARSFRSAPAAFVRRATT